MNEDLVARLRERNSYGEILLCHPPRPAPDHLCHEAADRIEALEAENERLRQTGAFLLARLDDLEWLDGQLEATAREYFGHVEPAIYHFRAALGEKQ